jgi:hypothetical protein
MVVPSELFFFRDKAVTRVVAFFAKRNRSLHLFSGKILLEPFVSVAHPRDQVMFSRATFRDSAAKFTG